MIYNLKDKKVRSIAMWDNVGGFGIGWNLKSELKNTHENHSKGIKANIIN